MMRICIDGGPTENGHRTRGIGWAVRHLLRAITAEKLRHFGLEGSCLRRTRPDSALSTTGLAWAQRAWTAELTGVDPRVPPGIAELLQIAETATFMRGDIERTGAEVFLATDPTAMPRSPAFRTVAIVYDVIPLAMPELYLGRAGSRRDRLYRRQLRQLADADHLLAISSATRNDLVDLAGIAASKITVAPLAADRSVFYPRDSAAARSRLAAAYGIDRPFVLFVGECDPRKNALRLGEAMRQIVEKHDVMLVMVGTVRGATIAVKESMHAMLGPERLKWLEQVPLDDLPLLYSACSVFAFPSLYEGFGLPVLEALSCAAPVVTSNRSSLPEIAGDAALYVDPESVQEIHATIRSVLESKSAQALLRTKGPLRASQFSWDHTADIVLKTCSAIGTSR